MNQQRRTLAMLSGIALAFCTTAMTQAQTSRPAPAPPMPMPMPAALVEPGAKVQAIATDFEFTEGPTADKEGNVYFVDQPNNRIMKYSVDGKMTEWMKPSGYANGMTFDNNGKLIACADEKNEMWSIDTATKEKKVILKGDQLGKYFNGPNDVWCHPTTGRLYFTDPYYRRDWWKQTRGERIASEMPQCVYFLEPDTGKVVKLIEDFRQPNGIVGSPDGKKLYVADIQGRKTWSYDIQEDGTLANKQPFCDSGSDGMTIDADGNVYLSSRTIQVFDKTGKKLGDIPVPESPANMCFGGKDHKTLFITARKGFYAIPMQVQGGGPQ
jgi:gluconolactonase